MRNVAFEAPELSGLRVCSLGATEGPGDGDTGRSASRRTQKLRWKDLKKSKRFEWMWGS